jgi:predicted regulator of Ras-like GTPase activity (Roadblock/LC7/MglB family)
MPDVATRAQRLQQALSDLLLQCPEVQAAAVVSFDGLPMASALPTGMDEDRVAAMSAALLSLGERAAEGLGRGELSQVYIEGEHGNVYLVSADNEAVLVVVAAAGAKVGMVLYEIRLVAEAVADVLRRPASPQDDDFAAPSADAPTADEQIPFQPFAADGQPLPGLADTADPLGLGSTGWQQDVLTAEPARAVPDVVPLPPYDPVPATDPVESTGWSGYLPNGGAGETSDWS